MKRINQARKTMAAMDDLPAELREALRDSNKDFDADYMRQLLDQGYSVWQCIKAIEVQQHQQKY